MSDDRIRALLVTATVANPDVTTPVSEHLIPYPIKKGDYSDGETDKLIKAWG